MNPKMKIFFNQAWKISGNHTSLRDKGKGSARNICKKSLGRDVYLGVSPIFWLGCFFHVDLHELFYIFWRLILCCFVCKYFLPFWGLSFCLNYLILRQGKRQMCRMDIWTHRGWEGRLGQIGRLGYIYIYISQYTYIYTTMCKIDS